MRRADGGRFSRNDVHGALVLPGWRLAARPSSFTDNFHVIRRYNPSDFYALAVGLLGNDAA